MNAYAFVTVAQELRKEKKANVKRKIERKEKDILRIRHERLSEELCLFTRWAASNCLLSGVTVTGPLKQERINVFRQKEQHTTYIHENGLNLFVFWLMCVDVHDLPAPTKWPIPQSWEHRTRKKTRTTFTNLPRSKTKKEKRKPKALWPAFIPILSLFSSR